MNNFVVGTAGHVDHGKTKLIEALTGVSTDFLKEEKERGISINLGFTYIDLNDKRIGIIDVPGHEKFIRNMMSGACGMDAVMLVIDATSGVMPQTIEHINILTFLNIKASFIVLTKIDLLTKIELDNSIKNVRKALSGTIFENVDIYPVDSLSGYGIDKVKTALSNLSDTKPEKENLPSRMYIDRVFSLHGHGTVITGTLNEGTIKIGESLSLFPQNIKVKVKNIQVHSENKEIAFSGQRVALNLQNIDYTKLHRGNILTSSDSLQNSYIINVRLNLLKNSFIKIKHWTRLKLFHGACEVLCRAVPLESECLSPGASEYVQLRLESPIYAKPYDNFVLRSFSPTTTIGGGTIVEVGAKKSSSIDNTRKNILTAIEKQDLKEYVKNIIKTKPFIYISDVLKALSINKLTDLDENFIVIDKIIIERSYIDKLNQILLDILRSHYKINSESYGISKTELTKNAEISSIIFDMLLPYFKGIEINNNIISISGKSSTLNSEDNKIKDDILKKIDSAGFSSLIKYDSIINSNKEKNIVSRLISEKKIIKLEENFIISDTLFNKAVELLKNHIDKHKNIDVKTFKDILNCGRRNAIIILESFDRYKITKRSGNVRVLY